ncbi:MAG: THUMP domain-containing protein [Methanobacteriaceae archaeon]
MRGEKFDLLIHFDSNRNKWDGQELLGIVELQKLLKKSGAEFFIKESEFPHMVMVEVENDALETFHFLLKAPAKVISRAMFIESAVATCGNQITDRAVKCIGKKASPGDTFMVRCYLKKRRYINSCRKLIIRIENEIINGFKLQLDHEHPRWIVHLEFLGENTGITVLEAGETPLDGVIGFL